MEPRIGYVRYKRKEEQNWTGEISEELLTPKEIQIKRFQGYIFEKDYSSVPDLKIPKPPKTFKYQTLKNSDLETGVTYILCPNKKCGLFWLDSFFACSHYCPKQKEQKKMVACTRCKKPIVLPGDSCCMERIDHTCKDGWTPLQFQSGSKFRIIYDLPND